MSIEEAVQNLPYVDIQHDTLLVFEDIEQGTVEHEDIWVSGYCKNHASVHGRTRLESSDQNQVNLISRDGIELKRWTKTIHPPYKPKSKVPSPLHVNAIDVSPNGKSAVVAGPDGFLSVLSLEQQGTQVGQDQGKWVGLEGHVGDVLDVKWFPSGEVILSSSSDLSVRVWGAKDGINPRTFKGHTRAVTSLGIIGVGKQVVSASLDGTVRVWDVGQGIEIRKFEMGNKKAILRMDILEGPALRLLDVNDERVILAGSASGMEIIKWSDGAKVKSLEWGVGSNMVSMAFSSTLGLIATGHTNGVIALRSLVDLETKTLIRRNEASVYSLCFDGSDVFVGTASGLPARIHLTKTDEGGWTAETTEELAGWEAVGIETIQIGSDGAVYTAGGEGGVRRY